MGTEEGKAMVGGREKDGGDAHGLRDNGFPVGLRVLLVEDNLPQLLILEKMLQHCKYQVTKCQEAKDALLILREHETRFDLVISDYHMPGMDGIQLLQRVASQMDLPFVIISAYDRQEIVAKGVLSGACDYLIKPVKMESLEIIWQHVLRKRGSALKGIEGQRKVEDDNLTHARSVELKVPKNTVERSDDGHHEASGAVAPRKKRLIWTDELHEKFERAVNHLGHKNAVPQKILECMRRMNVPAFLSRENVASHLQKYRLNLQKIGNGSQQMPRKHSAFSSLPRTLAFDKSPSLLGGCTLPCCVTNQFPGQYLTTLQAPGPLAPIESNSIAMPLDCQSNHFQSTVPQPSFYPLTTPSSLEFLLDSASTIRSPSQKMNPLLPPLLAGDCDYRNSGYIPRDIQSLLVEPSQTNNNDAQPHSIYDDNFMLYQQLLMEDVCPFKPNQTTASNQPSNDASWVTTPSSYNSYFIMNG